MNQTQIKYARERITEVYREKKAAIKSKYIWVKLVLPLEEKLRRIVAGEYEIRKESPHWAKDDINHAIRFEPDENPNLKEELEAYRKLDAAYKTIIDNLILGDQQDALNALTEFEKTEY